MCKARRNHSFWLLFASLGLENGRGKEKRRKRSKPTTEGSRLGEKQTKLRKTLNIKTNKGNAWVLRGAMFTWQLCVGIRTHCARTSVNVLSSMEQFSHLGPRELLLSLCHWPKAGLKAWPAVELKEFLSTYLPILPQAAPKCM
jgi:hypothetical protein